MAKPDALAYEPGKRVMFKIKHARTADCVVAGFRLHKNGPDSMVGSLSARPVRRAGRAAARGRDLGLQRANGARSSLTELAPLRENALEGHPWAAWAGFGDGDTRMPGGHSRWSAGKDLCVGAAAARAVCEVKYDHLQGNRFRHAAIFQRFRPDKPPSECRYDQLEVTTPYELERVFAARGRSCQSSSLRGRAWRPSQAGRGGRGCLAGFGWRAPSLRRKRALGSA